MISARAFLAVGAAVMMPATLALIRTTFEDERERNVAIAIWGTLALVGSALGPIISGLLLKSFWWGSVFLINVPVVTVALAATLVLAPPNDAGSTKRWDLPSSLLALVALVGLVIAIKETAKTEPAPLFIVAAVLAAAVGGWAFARRQRRLPYPLLDFAIFRNRAFLAGVLAAGPSMFGIACIQLITTQRFQLVEGFTPLRAGLLVAAVAVGALPPAMAGGARFGSLIVVALLGSLLTAVYTATIDLPSGVPDSARDSLDSALALAGDDNRSLITAASSAFDSDYSTVRSRISTGLGTCGSNSVPARVIYGRSAHEGRASR